MDIAVERIQQQLFALQDLQYQEFQRKLMPSVAAGAVIGVRTPALRALAHTLYGTPEAETFLQVLPHQYYEENNLHGFLLEQMKDYSACVAAINAFLPYVDNWATCDMMRPKIFRKHLPELREEVRGWLASDQTYVVRFGIEMLMNHYLEGAFQPEYPEWVAAVRSEEYYVKMMAAWYFATALAKRYEDVLPYIKQCRLEPWTHNKAIQKAIESRRLSEAQKDELRLLKLR